MVAFESLLIEFAAASGQKIQLSAWELVLENLFLTTSALPEGLSRPGGEGLRGYSYSPLPTLVTPRGLSRLVVRA